MPRAARKRDRVEIVATLLLAIAAVATAWSSYQATRWNGEQAKATSRTNAIRIEAARAASLSEAETQVDVATFIQWVDAHLAGDAEVENFYVERFRAEFKPAFETWVATNPFTNADAPPSPFATPAYRLGAKADAKRLDREAEVSAATVTRNIQRSANYVLGVVLFTVALFFAGISTKLQTPRLRTGDAHRRLGALRGNGRVDRDVPDPGLGVVRRDAVARGAVWLAVNEFVSVAHHVRHDQHEREEEETEEEVTEEAVAFACGHPGGPEHNSHPDDEADDPCEVPHGGPSLSWTLRAARLAVGTGARPSWSNSLIAWGAASPHSDDRRRGAADHPMRVMLLRSRAATMGPDPLRVRRTKGSYGAATRS